MIPPSFEYVAPNSVDETIRLLERHGDEAKILAGGHSLIPLMKLRLAAPGVLVDLGKIPDFRYIEDRGNHIAIGAMTTQYMLETSDLLRRLVPIVPHASSTVGDMQVRNRGTLGGSLAHGDPASDLPTVMVALKAELVAQGRDGERVIPAGDFFQDIWTTALDPAEVLTEIRISYGQGTPAQTYNKFCQRASDWAIVAVAVDVKRSNDYIEDVSIVLTNVASTPLRAVAAEDALRGLSVSLESVNTASQKASEGLDPSPELKASPDYKRQLARVLCGRALQSVLQLR
jgi:aerobic carbon-monoxide dehydrogenase medium subunit